MSANDPKQTLAHYVLRSTFTFHAPSNSLAAKAATAIMPTAKTAARNDHVCEEEGDGWSVVSRHIAVVL